MINKIVKWIVAGIVLTSVTWISAQSAIAQNTSNDKTISTGLEHSIVIEDGKVWAWGRTTDSQLGNEPGLANFYRELPTKVPKLNNVTLIDAGDSHNLALDRDGFLWTWGSNYKGQLGDGYTEQRGQPLKILSQVTHLAGGYWHSVAVKQDGTVWTWGYNRNGQLGDGTTEDRFLPVQAEGLSDIVAVAAGFDHTLALQRDGTVWAWGNNHAGQLGDGTFELRSTPVKVKSLTNVVSIAAGDYHSVALKDDGTVWAWGYNDSGQLGDGTQIERPTAIQTANLVDIIAIASGGSNTVAIKRDGTVWGFGHWHYDLEGYTPFQMDGLTDVVEVATSERHSLAKKKDGSLWAWGWTSFGVLGIPFEEGKFVDTPIRVELGAQRQPQFKDLSPNHWAYENIEWAIDKGILSGYKDATVRPNHNVTEAEFLVMLYNTLGDHFLDSNSPQGAWYDPFYEFANEYRLPVHKSFANEPLTRGHLAQIIVNGLGFDYDIRHSVEYLLSNGFSSGRTAATYEGYEPLGLLTRGEAITFLRNVVNKGIDSLQLVTVESEMMQLAVGPYRAQWSHALDAERPFLQDELTGHLQQLPYNIQTDLEITKLDFVATTNGHIPYDAKIAILYLNNELIYDVNYTFAPFYNGTVIREERKLPQYEKAGFDSDAYLIARNVFRYWNDPRGELGESYLSLREQAYELFDHDVNTQQTNPDLLIEYIESIQKIYFEFFNNPFSEEEISRNILESF